MPRHVRKGDTVMITAGNYKGMTGEVLRVDADRNRVVVRGSRIKGVVKHRKPTRINPQGTMLTLDRSFHISNVSPVVDGKPTRVRFVTKNDGTKVRVAARNGDELHVLHGPRGKK
jgi:large subunit ribosomal protein L24